MNSSVSCTPVDCASCSARNASVFACLPPMQVSTLSQSKGCRTYRKGQLIYFADEFPQGLFCVHHGTIKIYKVGPDGREQIIRLAKGGDIIGYRSLISGSRYETFATPIEDAQICHIPKDTFFSLTHDSPDLSTNVLKLLANDLRAAERRIVSMAQRPVRERLAETLLILSETYGTDTATATLGIKLTRTELANMIGTTTESVSRLLSKMKDERTLALTGRRIAITNHRALVRDANVVD